MKNVDVEQGNRAKRRERGDISKRRVLARTDAHASSGRVSNF